MSDTIDGQPARRPTLRRASTLIVVRDDEHGMQVLLLRRVEHKSDPNSRAYVFPGGVVDPADKALYPHCSGLDDAAASERLGLPAGALDFYIAAIRECFEECGLLFALDRSLHLTSLQEVPADILADLRTSVHDATIGLDQVCRQLGLRLAVDRLAYHSHWLTPPGQQRRFDTRFFVAETPAGQLASLDSDETFGHLWIRPAEALAMHDMLLPRPTRTTLESIARFATAAECLAHTRQQRAIGMTMTRIGYGQHGPLALLPHEPAYAEIARIDPDGVLLASYELLPGRAVRLSERIWRITAPSSNALAGPGANTYLVGDCDAGAWAVIDPGPADERHVQAILAAASGKIRWIFVTHTDASGAATLEARTGAQLFHQGFQHGAEIRLGNASTLRVLHALGPGRLCYLLIEEKTLFNGAHPAYLAPCEDLEWIAPGHGFLIPKQAP